MQTGNKLHLHLRTQKLDWDATGHSYWRVITTERVVPATEVAIVICDMWDKHWCRGAVERLNAVAPRMNQVIKTAREKGVLIIHAPSDTMSFYKDTPARLRIQNCPRANPPQPIEHDDPPQPIDTSDPGSDTGETVRSKPRTRQNEALEIDQERDVISEDGLEIYSYMQARGIKYLFIMGVHTNRCILNRSFGIKQMVRWGVNVGLVRDLTDALYNPATPPYVSHSEGVRLVIEYIEKFWCPTITSDDFMLMEGATL